ncbi:spaetzle domain-containing protein [Nomia melanderi]|uniref:spaetzle domain-containing protein n=1 Tax=Nomia melanderi TaxID=2448451 RepID=UPI001304276A|nr:protein spaetzle [Nomia melanderi]
MKFASPTSIQQVKNSMALMIGTLFLLIFESYGYSQESTIQLKFNEELLRAVPTCGKGTFCETIPHYPQDLVAAALAKNPHLKLYGYSDEMDTPPRVEGPEEEPLCVSVEQVVFPKSGVTKNNQWKYIVNHEELKQSVRIETCLEEDKPCRVIEGFAEGYVTKCKQKYIYRQLLSLGSDGLMSQDSFRFPANCCCHIEFLGDKFLKK